MFYRGRKSYYNDSFERKGYKKSKKSTNILVFPFIQLDIDHKIKGPVSCPKEKYVLQYIESSVTTASLPRLLSCVFKASSYANRKDMISFTAHVMNI